MAQKSFDLGDVVCLASQPSRRMTIEGSDDGLTMYRVKCVWFDEAGQLHRDIFYGSSLQKV